eukprot:TRINITY_DN73511_c0_g1_i1.p1 TRINITY_DN73511_c0_g1~~TRINITY_DN73511_c0_g1_i1.p1  ORF type:complete len:1042 (-),score=105.61 TRINITY_DN73511_c0_g1_i1:201-3326(-)
MLVLVWIATAPWTSQAAVPFSIPFAVEPYTGGHLEAVGDDGKSGAVVYWRTTLEEVHVGLAAAGTWVGFGMNEKSPSMQGADIVVCREHQPSVVSAADYIATRLGAPELDVVQDWVTLAGGRQHYSPPAPPAGACKTGWTFGMNKCYKVGSAANYATARSACENDGGSLVNIQNDAENKFVLQLALGNPEAERALVWIGVSRTSVSAAWTAPDRSTGPYTNWHSSAPTAGDYDNCAILGIVKTQETYGKKPDEGWWSGHCLWAEPRSVCERPVEPGTPVVDPSLYEPRLPVTWCEISRSRETCDPSEDYQIKDLTISISGLLAWSPPSQGHDLLRYHQAGNRRQQLFSFAGTAAAAGADRPSDAVEVIFEPPAHSVSAAGGSFAYSYHKFDIDPSKTYHVIAWRVALNSQSQAGQAGLQHHMDLRGCSGPIPGAVVGAAISSALAMQYCQENFLVGSGTLPSDEGIPIGQGGPIYLAIERHYYNPTGKLGKMDSGSKFYVTYTEELRPREMSSLHIGTLALKVPPKTFGYVMRSHCPPGCTAKMGSVKATRVSFHAHGHAKAAWLRLVRDQKELEPIAHIEPYDDATASRNINIEIKPGDELLLDCVYDNDLNKDIIYGDAIDQEMCWATLSVVGKSSMTKCYDFPDVASNKWATYDTDCKWCVDNNNFDGACWQCNIAIPFARCPAAGEDWGTGRIDDSFGRRGDPNAGNTADILKYTPLELLPVGCDAKLGVPDVVPAIAGKCPASGEVISGSKECLFKWGGSMLISWETDCANQTVKFQLEKRGTTGWMAIGLIDAGTTNNPKAFPSTRMNGADIMQVSASTGYVKDALGSDYLTPAAKSVAVAQLVSTEVSAGTMKASFTRPFASPEGTSLSEDKFVWLICAYRGSSNDLDAKHQQASALTRARISLFGGVAESTRYVMKTSNASSTLSSPASSGPSGSSNSPSPSPPSSRGSSSPFGPSSSPSPSPLSSPSPSGSFSSPTPSPPSAGLPNPSTSLPSTSIISNGQASAASGALDGMRHGLSWRAGFCVALLLTYPW